MYVYFHRTCTRPRENLAQEECKTLFHLIFSSFEDLYNGYMINMFILQSPVFNISLLSAQKKENKSKSGEVNTCISVWNWWSL